MKRLITLTLLLSASFASLQAEEKLDLSRLAELNSRKLDQLTITRGQQQQQRLLLGGSGAHGGDFRELPIHDLGWGLVERLAAHADLLPFSLESFAEGLTNLTIEIVQGLELNGEARLAVNIPDQYKIILTEQAYHFLTSGKIDELDQARFFLHEFLPLIGHLDDGYQLSYQVIDLLASEHHRGLVPQRTLLSLNTEMSYSEAQKICEAAKRRHKSEYFDVYCLFKEETHHYYALAPWWIHHGLASRYGRHFSTPRVYRWSEITYGLKVMGLGPVDQLEEVKILDGERVDAYEFERSAEARMACEEIRSTRDDVDYRYVGSRCEIYQTEKGYRFHLLTKNPFALLNN